MTAVTKGTDAMEKVIIPIRTTKSITNEQWYVKKLAEKIQRHEIHKPKFQRRRKWKIFPDERKDMIPSEKKYIEFLYESRNSVHAITFGIFNNVLSNIDGNNRINAIMHFLEKPFEIFPERIYDLENFLKTQKCDIFYSIKFGKNDGMVFDNIKNVVHCVFEMLEPHGQVYAAVSQQIANKYNQSLFVPHMIGLKPSTTKENLRSKLNIPENAVVFGRYGGFNQFDISYVHHAIIDHVNKNSNTYFMKIFTQYFHFMTNIIKLSHIYH